MAKNLVLNPIFVHLAQIWAPKFESNLRKLQKTQSRTQFWSIWPKFSLSNFFSKIWLHQSLNVMVSYCHVQYQKKLMIQSWQNLVTDGRMDRRKYDEWLHRRLSTNVERPKRGLFYNKLVHWTILIILHAGTTV